MRKIIYLFVFLFIFSAAYAEPFWKIKKECIGIGGKPIYETKTRKVVKGEGERAVIIVRELFMKDGIAIVVGKDRRVGKGYNIIYIGPYLGHEGGSEPDDGQNQEWDGGGREEDREQGPRYLVGGPRQVGQPTGGIEGRYLVAEGTGTKESL